jgi:hypothetical protein
VRSLHDVLEMNAYRADHLTLLPVHMSKFENRWSDFDEIWYGRHAVAGY